MFNIRCLISWVITWADYESSCPQRDSFSDYCWNDVTLHGGNMNSTGIIGTWNSNTWHNGNHSTLHASSALIENDGACSRSRLKRSIHPNFKHPDIIFCTTAVYVKLMLLLKAFYSTFPSIIWHNGSIQGGLGGWVSSYLRYCSVIWGICAFIISCCAFCSFGQLLTKKWKL